MQEKKQKNTFFLFFAASIVNIKTSFLHQNYLRIRYMAFKIPIFFTRHLPKFRFFVKFGKNGQNLAKIVVLLKNGLFFLSFDPWNQFNLQFWYRKLFLLHWLCLSKRYKAKNTICRQMAFVFATMTSKLYFEYFFFCVQVNEKKEMNFQLTIALQYDGNDCAVECVVV